MSNHDAPPEVTLQQTLETLDRLGTPALAIGPHGRATLNSQWCELAGAPPAWYRWTDLLAPEYRQQGEAWLEDAREAVVPATMACEVQHAAGLRHWCLLKLTRWQTPGAVAWICEAIDIEALKARERKLEEDVAAHSQMLDVSADCIKLIARDGHLLHMNKAGCQALGVSQDSGFGMRWSSLLPGKVSLAAEAALREAVEGTPSRFAGRSESDAMGEQLWDNLLTPVRTPEGEIRAVLCVSREVTAERRAVQNLRENEERLAIAARVGGLGIWDYDIRHDILHCDASWYRIMGRDTHPPIRSIADFRPMIHPDDVDRATDVVRTAAELIAEEKDYSITFRIVRPNGDVRWIRSLAYIEEQGGTAVRAVGFVADITDAWRGELALRDANRALQEEKTSLARKLLEDPLTGISNRRHLDSELARIWVHANEAGHPLSVGMIDVDRFKQFNDRYGHLAGDAALRKIATTLQSVARRTDLIARYGGEEFAFVLAGSAEPTPIIEKFLAAVADLAIPHEDSPTGILSISCGAVVSFTVLQTPKQLIQASDEALYEAKLAGRDRYVIRILDS